MMLQELAPEYAGNSAQGDERICGFTNGTYSRLFCGGVFEQLARYTMRYQESDLHLGLYSS